MSVAMYPLATAAEMLGRSPATVGRWVRKHRIPTQAIGNATCVDDKGLERLRIIDRSSPRFIVPATASA